MIKVGQVYKPNYITWPEKVRVTDVYEIENYHTHVMYSTLGGGVTWVDDMVWFRQHFTRLLP